jgi:hypothetical protein
VQHLEAAQSRDEWKHLTDQQLLPALCQRPVGPRANHAPVAADVVAAHLGRRDAKPEAAEIIDRQAEAPIAVAQLA